MTTFVWLQKYREVITDEYYDVGDKDIAAVLLQREWRKTLARYNFETSRCSCMMIQRCFRVYLCKRNKSAKTIQLFMRCCKAKFEVNLRKLEILKFQSSKAVIIQGMVRGVLLRKKKLDFYRRKEYIAGILHQNMIKRNKNIEISETLRLSRLKQREKVIQEEFFIEMKRFHHLLSTANCPGVYHSEELVFGKTIEEHLKSC